jgi:glycosyltransferase involved in cell wall biosynthesis
MKNKFKKLAIISDCVHVVDKEGNIASQNHIYIKQMQALSSHFESTMICCPFVKYTPDMVLSHYTNKNIEFLHLKNVGGNSLFDKIKICINIFSWLKAFKKASDFADIVYQRFPNNLNVPGFFYFFFKRKKVFATYTGTWKDYKNEPITYRFQKWLLKHFFRGPVWVYVDAEISPKILKGISPSYSLKIFNDERFDVDRKLADLKNNIDFIPRFITVGSLVPHKNQQFILNAFKTLYDQGYRFELYVVGGGKLQNSYIDFVRSNKLENNIFITGKKTDLDLQKLYRLCNFLVQAPVVEGFGKVPIEGFFHGVIPILNDVGLAREMTGNGKRGFLFNIFNAEDFLSLLKNITANKKLMYDMIVNGREYSKNHTLENWSNEYIKVVNEYFEN